MLNKLLHGSEAVGSLFGVLPFGGAVPLRLRASVYDFKFSQSGDTAWWERTFVRRILEASREEGVLVDEDLATAMRARGEVFSGDLATAMRARGEVVSGDGEGPRDADGKEGFLKRLLTAKKVPRPQPG